MRSKKAAFTRAVPAPCVVVGIDSGKVSGWSIYVGEARPRIYGLAVTADDKRYVIAQAALLGQENRMHVIIGAEKWKPGFKSHLATVGTGASWGRWETILELEGLSRNVLRVEVDDWRKAILSPDPKMKREQLKELAVRSAIARGLVRKDEGSHDAVEAVFIGLYFVYAQETKDLLESIPRRRT
jgi:hypothetical protein